MRIRKRSAYLFVLLLAVLGSVNSMAEARSAVKLNQSNISVKEKNILAE